MTFKEPFQSAKAEKVKAQPCRRTWMVASEPSGLRLYKTKKPHCGL